MEAHADAQIAGAEALLRFEKANPHEPLGLLAALRTDREMVELAAADVSRWGPGWRVGVVNDDGVEYAAGREVGVTSPFPVRWLMRGSPPPTGLDVERRLWILENIGIEVDEAISTPSGLRGQHAARRQYLELLDRRDCP